MNAIERALADHLRSPVLGHVELARDRSALPLYSSWTGTVFLTCIGEFLFLDEEADPPQLRAEHDHQSQLMSLAIASERYPILSNLLPARSTEAENCNTCKGTGITVFGNGRIRCGECCGVGWPGKLHREAWLADISTLPYPPFDEAVRRLSALAAKEDHHGELLFISSSDAAFLRGVFYVAVPYQRAAIAKARRKYDAAARRRLGVLLATAGYLRDGRSIAYVSSPTNAKEAIERMYADGLKLSVLTSPRGIRLVGRIQLALLRAIAALLPNNPTAAERLG